ncbi:hypothetical protein MCFN_02310 [Mycoplasmopsis californica]|uniref:Uncharacterized protein n=1 Tax=Mycoplasmopsis californica TaxID=2113 RepID=A0A059XM49_9BACT|nr:hypothetical protein MCFN_02310 [Mycoplasmopsis californica]
MKNKGFIDRAIIIHWIIFVLCCFVFGIAIIYSHSLILGYVIGSSLSYLLLEMRIFFTTKSLSSKSAAWIFSILSWLSSLLLVSVILASILLINKYVSTQENLMTGSINVFAFSFSLIQIQIAIMISHIKFKIRKG